MHACRSLVNRRASCCEIEVAEERHRGLERGAVYFAARLLRDPNDFGRKGLRCAGFRTAWHRIHND